MIFSFFAHRRGLPIWCISLYAFFLCRKNFEVIVRFWEPQICWPCFSMHCHLGQDHFWKLYVKSVLEIVSFKLGLVSGILFCWFMKGVVISPLQVYHIVVLPCIYIHRTINQDSRSLLFLLFSRKIQVQLMIDLT